MLWLFESNDLMASGTGWYYNELKMEELLSRFFIVGGSSILMEISLSATITIQICLYDSQVVIFYCRSRY